MDRFIYLLFRTFEWLISLLPLGLVIAIGRMIGRLAHAFLPRYRQLALRNLWIAFSDEKTDREIRKLAREHLKTLGGNFLSTIKIGSMSQEKIEERLTMENFEILQKATENGKGVIWVLSHLGNWELCTQAAKTYPDIKLATVYQKLSNPFMDAHVRKQRERFGIQTLERKDGYGGPSSVLRSGGWLGVLVDQHAGDAGVWTPLFNRLASTSSLAATLAIRTGAALVPVAVYSVPAKARWRLVVRPPIPQTTTDPSELTAEINRTLESMIREQPADWFWVHNRWKTPKPKFLLSTYKRGISYPKDFDAGKLKPFKIAIRASNWLGDAVMTVPAMRAIKFGRPDAHVTILTQEKLADFWKAVPEVDEVVCINRSVWSSSRRIRASGFEIAILFPNSLRSALEVWLAGVPRIVGNEGHSRKRFLNQIHLEKNKPPMPRHQVADYLELASFVGADPAAGKMKKRERVGTQSAAGPLRLALCPGAEYGPAKRWLPERFAEVARRMADSRQVEWMLVGTAKDRPLCEEIASTLGNSCKNIAGETTLAELMDLLRSCRLLLTNDTGTMHLAAYLGVPTVAVFGSTEPLLTGPLGTENIVVRQQVECSPCFLRECPIDFRCMKSVTADDVTAAIERVLA